MICRSPRVPTPAGSPGTTAAVFTEMSMIRQMFRLAYEAAKIEVERLLSPWPAATRAAVATKIASKWQSPSYHVEVLKSTTCPECEAPKSVGAYFCRGCLVQMAQRGRS